MINRRQFSRAAARRNRFAARAAEAETARTTAQLLGDSLVTARRVIADQAFVQLLYAQEIQSIPRALGPGVPSRRTRPHGLLDCSVEFVIAWTFLFPLFKRTEIRTYLDTAWPGFILQMKDAFIAVVVEGPFPHAMSGFCGRRRGAVDRPAEHRAIATKRQSV